MINFQLFKKVPEGEEIGSVTPALLVIAGAFMVVIYGIILALSLQLNFSNRDIALDQSLYIAEAGVNYYRWHLAHEPEDFQDGTGGPGPYVHTYTDPQGAEVGEFSLEIVPPEDGSSIVTIRSTGRTNDFPGISRTVEVQYGRPSFANYSFLSNASTWYGTNITVNGNIHSNNGIRMDGTNTGQVTSAKETYMCGTETGCFPPTEQPGVWGSGGDQSLWQFPVTPIDFGATSFDFAQMRTGAQNSGVYLPESGDSGYHVTFTAETVTIAKVTATGFINGYLPPGQGLGQQGQGGCRRRFQLIENETPVGTFNLSDTPIIFAEDNLWVEGNIDGRITVVAAGFPVTSSKKNIWIRGNITYADQDGSDILGLIAQNDIYFARDLPDDFRIDAALMAQGGQIVRHGYWSGCGGPTNSIRNSLTINGSLISFNKSFWNYTSGGEIISGFIARTINYDGGLLFSPPPFFPTAGEFEFITWREK